MTTNPKTKTTMHTPEQARELWCPMARAAHHQFSSIDPTGRNELRVLMAGCNTDDRRVPPTCHCIANKCAMWRWDESQTNTNVRRRRFVDDPGETEPQRPDGVGPEWVFVPRNEEEGDPAFWLEPEEMQQARRRGYCGLAPIHSTT